MDKYIISIKGKNPDYFLKKIIQKNVNIYNIGKKHNELILILDVDGYKKIKQIKTSYVIEVLDVSGFLKVKEFFNKYFFFILFFLFGVLLNVFLSNVIFQVEVIHSNKYIRELVYADLKSFGISKFKFKVNFDEKEAIVQKILKKEKDDIEWLEIKNIGTKYVVNVEQRKKTAEKSACINRNIVAGKNASIISIEAESGEIVKKKQDYVLKDEVIISGIIHNKEDVVSNKCAVGKVFGEVWYKVVVELPTSYKEVSLTGRSSYKLGIEFLKKNYVLFNDYSTYKVHEGLGLINKILPISATINKYIETKEVNHKYNLSNVDEAAIQMACDKFKSKLGKEDEILTKKVLKKERNESKIIVEVFLKVKEDITAYKEILKTEINEDGG